MLGQDWMDTAETAELLSRLAGKDVNARMVRDWARRDGLPLMGADVRMAGRRIYLVDRVSLLDGWEAHAVRILGVVRRERGE